MSQLRLVSRLSQRHSEPLTAWGLSARSQLTSRFRSVMNDYPPREETKQLERSSSQLESRAAGGSWKWGVIMSASEEPGSYLSQEVLSRTQEASPGADTLPAKNSITHDFQAALRPSPGLPG